jgi:hypothetical protein
MQSRFIGFLVSLICLAVLFAGCTGTTGSPAPSGAGPALPSSGSSAPAGAQDNLAVSPTDALPGQNLVTVDISEKDYLGMIPVIFQGGTGQIHVKKIDVTLYRADGQVKTASIGNKKGDMVELEGTKQPDRVVVYITFDNGDRMKTNDVMSPYRTRN